MQIAFCDDDEQECKWLLECAAGYAAQSGLRIAPRAYPDAESLLRDPTVTQMTAVFLDIYMEGISGLEAARALRGRGYSGAIVLVTTSRDHFADGFVVDASHYLLKPVKYESFSEAMRRVLRLSKTVTNIITVRCGRDRVRVPVSQIQYAEVYNHETLLHLKGRTLMIGHSLSALENMLGGEPFLRCYRSHIVNMDYVERIDSDSFVMKNGTRLLIARDGRKGVQGRYFSYVFSRMEEM